MAASHDGIVVGYNTADCKLRGEGKLQAVACSNFFDLIIPWLDRWRNENPGSLVDWRVNEENYI